MSKVIFALIGTIFLAMVGVAGDFFIKLAGNGKKYIELKWFIIGLLIYSITAFGWFFVMKHIKFSTLGVFYAVSTVLFLTLVGSFYFKESLSIYEISGIILAIISLVLMGKFA
jgi:undecaprenyl phosphate-alpha-L-ara4N flippase subunit ArnF